MVKNIIAAHGGDVESVDRSPTGTWRNLSIYPAPGLWVFRIWRIC